VFRHWGFWLFTLIVGVLVLLPISMLILGSLSDARLPSEFSIERLNLNNYVAAYANPLTYRVLGNTAIFVAGSMFFGLTFAFLVAWLVARTDMPGKWLAHVGIPVSLAIPGMLESMAWVLLFSPRIGFANRFAMSTFGLDSAPFDVYTMTGMIALESLRTVPTAFLMFFPLLFKFDPALEEAALMSGSRLGGMVGRVTLPLLLPGIVSIGIYQAVAVLSSFEVPGILGMPGQVYVFSTLIYTYSAGALGAAGGGSYGVANALAMIYLVINVFGLWVYARVTRNASSFAVITGKGYRPRRIELGPWRWVGLLVIVGYLFIAIIAPIAVLIWTSITPRILQPVPDSLAAITGRVWLTVFSNPSIVHMLWNTAIMMLATATGTVVLCLAIGWITVRTRFKGKGLLEQLAFISHGVPGIIMALALIWFWIQIDFIPMYGTLWILVLGFILGFMAYGTRSTSAAILQIHSELEEAAYISGASTLTAIRRVVAPLLLPALAGLWIWVALHAVRFVTLPLMLQTGPNNEVIAAYLWSQWSNGNPNIAAALGLALVAFMLVFTVIATWIGGRRTSLSR
jgi:iron(III) transport system permease protein